MRRPRTVRGLEELGRTRLSPHFFLRDFLYSEIAAVAGIPNIPENPDLAIAAGRRLCTEILEPLHATFGGVAIRSAYRSPAVNEYGNRHGFNCATNEKNRARHIWDRRDADGCRGAVACIVVPWFVNRYERAQAPGFRDWRPLAWWIHDYLPYSGMQFFPKLAAFNIGWHERPRRTIYGYAAPKGWLTRPGMPGHDGDHAALYAGFPALKRE